MITKKTFEKTMQTIAEYNKYPLDACTTVEECNKIGKDGCWTPVDLVCREMLNNGGGSAKGFLGISPTQCKNCFEYIIANQEELRSENRYNKTGISNFGFVLWDDYKIGY